MHNIFIFQSIIELAQVLKTYLSYKTYQIAVRTRFTFKVVFIFFQTNKGNFVISGIYRKQQPSFPCVLYIVWISSRLPKVAKLSESLRLLLACIS